MKKILLLFLASTALVLLLGSCNKKCECLCPKPADKTLTLRPGPDDGQDCIVSYRETDKGLYAGTNMNFNTDLAAIRWTYNSDNAGQGTTRSYIKFGALSTIPQTAVIKSAKLSLMGVTSGVAAPQGNSGDNKCWLKRVIGNWDKTTITWNNKPGTTDANQVEVPGSPTQWNYSVPDIDVTAMVREMVINNQNYGFCLQLQTEDIYRSIVFGSSKLADSTKRPKLEVIYQ